MHSGVKKKRTTKKPRRCDLSELIDQAEKDPGPMARFAAVTGDPATPEIIVQRVACGETLSEIARAWGLPRTRFLAWVAAQGDLSETCRRVRELAGIELRLEGLDIVDEVEGAKTSEEVAAAKLRAEYRERLARDLNRPLFGKQVQHQHTHHIDLGERLRRARERVIDHVPESVTTGAALPAVTPGAVPAPEVVEAELI